MIEQKPFIMTMQAESLPDNERTREILAQRAAAEEARQLRLEQVSLTSWNAIVAAVQKRFKNMNCLTAFVGTSSEGKGRKGPQTARKGSTKSDERKRETCSRLCSQASRGRRAEQASRRPHFDDANQVGGRLHSERVFLQRPWTGSSKNENFSQLSCLQPHTD